MTEATEAALYGKDIYCADSLRTGRYARGVLVIAHNALHRLDTPRGMLRGGEEEENYGIDLLEIIGSISSPSDEASIPQKIRGELTKDPRIEDVRASLERIADGPIVTYEITIDADTSEGPFELVLSAADVTLEVLKLVTT